MDLVLGHSEPIERILLEQSVTKPFLGFCRWDFVIVIVNIDPQLDQVERYLGG